MLLMHIVFHHITLYIELNETSRCTTSQSNVAKEHSELKPMFSFSSNSSFVVHINTNKT